jgi:hypothetical protein
VYRTATGQEVWSQKVSDSTENSFLTTDPEGKLLAFQPRLKKPHEPGECVLVDMESRKFFASLPFALPNGISPRASLVVRSDADDENRRELALIRGRDAELLVRLAIDTSVSSVQSEFDAEGRLLVWGNVDGSVSVCDIPEVQRRLAELGLGW